MFLFIAAITMVLSSLIIPIGFDSIWIWKLLEIFPDFIWYVYPFLHAMNILYSTSKLPVAVMNTGTDLS